MGYTKIASITVGASPVTSVTFSSIPQTYKDLVLKMCAGSTAGLALQYFTFNGSTSNFQYTAIRAGANAIASFGTGINAIWASYNSYDTSTFSNSEAYISNYTGSTYKSASVDAVNEMNNNADVYSVLNTGLWSDTAAITSITVTATAQQNSTFYLYGVI